MRWFKEQIDRWAIRAAAKSLPKTAGDPTQRIEAEKWLRRQDLFVPPETVPNVKLDRNGMFQFASSVQTPFPSNNIAHGKLFPTRGEWQKRPSVVVLHGWNAEMHFTSVLPSVARALASCGINGVLLELPYHLHRRPPRGHAVTNFISENIPRMLEATTQAVADLNATLHWLKALGSPSVATWGFSLGAWLTGLHLTASPTQDLSVLTTPVSDLERAVRELAFCHPIRSALDAVPLDLSPLNLHARIPRIAPDRIHVMQAKYDTFVPGETCEALAKAWKLPEWARVPQSHITILVSRPAMKQAIEWLEARLC